MTDGTGKKESRVRACVRALTAYSEEAGDGLNLSNNTNLFGANPALGKALAEARAEAYGEYPSLTSRDLRDAIAKHHGVPADAVITGNGSNELIDVAVRTFADAGARVAFHPPTFSMIPFYVAAQDAVPAPIPLDGESFRFPVDAFARENAPLSFVCTPNNPTGNAFPVEDVRRVMDESDGVVVVDEAYMEFAEQPGFIREAVERENVVVLRTFSKAHGLAGLRVGYAVANPALATEMAKIRGPFRLNAFSELAAIRALAEDAYLARTVDTVRAERARLTTLLESRGCRVFPSDANFLLFRPPVDAGALANAIAARGYQVRDFGGDLAPFLRVTVGPPEVTDAFVDAFDAAMKEVSA